jgi:hypothetical protein
MNESSSFAIGDPGRAAVETRAGVPPAIIGQPDVTLSTVSVGRMVIQAASSRGVLHRARQTVRQDAFALGHRTLAGEPEQAVVVVCDGVGSMKYSHYAAALVSQRLAEQVAAGADWWHAFEYANGQLGKTNAEWRQTTYGPIATTAVGLTVRREGDCWTGQAAWVGDSALWHLGDDLSWSLVSGSAIREEASYHSSEVRPLPVDDASWAWCSFRIRGGALFAMTDGVSNPLTWSSEVRDTLARWWTRPPDPYTFAAQIGFSKKTHVDDRTVVGIWPDMTGDSDAGKKIRPGQA